MNKYGNKKTEIHGITFDSKAEARRYGQLLLLERAGKISGLELQPVFILIPAVVISGRKRPAIKYIADFRYTDDAGKKIVEDTKGMLTPVYKIKRHLMMHVHGVEILETA